MLLQSLLVVLDHVTCDAMLSVNSIGFSDHPVECFVGMYNVDYFFTFYKSNRCKHNVPEYVFNNALYCTFIFYFHHYKHSHHCFYYVVFFDRLRVLQALITLFLWK